MSGSGQHLGPEELSDRWLILFRPWSGVNVAFNWEMQLGWRVTGLRPEVGAPESNTCKVHSRCSINVASD